MNSIIIIPSRLASTRLPNKPLADIDGEPMIIRVMEQAEKAKICPVVVACGDKEIADVVTKKNGRAVITRPDLPSGTDRIHAALNEIDPDKKIDYIINLQGDMPLISHNVFGPLLDFLEKSSFDIVTMATETKKEHAQDPNIVKCVGTFEQVGHLKAHYFSRQPVPTNGPWYHHIGVYGFKRRALDNFVNSPPSMLETSESLEQLRALDNGMTIGVSIIDQYPQGVDTEADLEQVRKLFPKLTYKKESSNDWISTRTR